MGRARRGRWSAALLAAATVGLAGVGPALLATAQPAWAFVGTIDITQGNSFSPKTIEIEIGDKVLWRNRSDVKHTVTADSGEFDYTFGAQGAQEERRFNEAKTYAYHCEFHDGMKGTVVVRDPNAPTTAKPATTTTTAPPATTTTAPPATTTTTAPPATTTTVPPRPPAEVPPAPVPNPAAAPPPTLATSSTTTMPPTTTTTAPATTTSAPPAPAGDQGASSSTSASAPPTTETTRAEAGGEQTAAGRPASSDGRLDFGAVVLIGLLVVVGLFGAWTLIRVRPGRI